VIAMSGPREQISADEEWQAWRAANIRPLWEIPQAAGHGAPAVPPPVLWSWQALLQRAIGLTSPAVRRVRYVNPLTGGPVMPYLDCYLICLEAGQTTLPFQTSARAV